ncbi:3'(2'),5'-bisphosphate nucleotidase CysQ [Mariluticola halotolerans]|uniref:3'(2'),5'-bisphosphate nucleotidase CysQ n=1 Tax=Mariluticola halotolerans TaxID=2909283 RepID=UPI0026E1AE6C|nr:3'(2'),5'-bisphosphate nucleotidase CysQ [Mariluticola halotolerans]UJQ95863.1 3'(2'),5'-bisphosphate nucleotidase CysQ [Mariluticola halotolerans]
MAENAVHDIEADLQLLRSNAVAAGIIAAGYFRRELKSWTKENASPVTEADFLVDKFLMQSLRAARPGYGWLSEESVDDQSRLKAERVFIIDPIDGTRAFMRGDDCWAISLAVVENGHPIAGVIYAPARDELYHASKGGGAFLNGEKLTPDLTLQRPAIIPAPGAVHTELKADGLDYVRGDHYPSLAYRLVQVATGRVDAAVARRGAQDWDIAGAAIILSECGINFEDVCCGTPLYNRADTRHSALAAMADETLKPLVHGALLRVYGCPDTCTDDLNLEQRS